MTQSMNPWKRLMVIGAAAALLASVPVTASAQEVTTDDPVVETDTTDRPTIDQVKERADAAIERRLAALDRAAAKVRTNDHVTADHAAQLITHYIRASDGLNDLRRDIAQATTYEELRDLVPMIAEDYRVYLVILPKTHLVLASDRMADGVTRMSNAADGFLDAIERAEDAGYDMTEARKWLRVARDEIAEVNRTAVPVADDVVGLTAADWEEPAKTQLDTGKRKLTNARVDVAQAIDALKKTKRAIESAVGG